MKYALFLGALFCLTTLLLSQPLTKIFIVRHADRLQGDALSEAGIARAEELKRVLGQAFIQRIFTTETLRAYKTAEPLAELLHLSRERYNSVPGVINLIKSIPPGLQGKRILIVGHSDTVDDLIRQCGCIPPSGITPDMPATQFDNLFLVVLRKTIPNMQVSWICQFIHMKYGAVTN